MLVKTTSAPARSHESDERNADNEEPEQRDDDDRAGEEHGATGRIDSRDDRIMHSQPVMAAFAETGDDKERVIDADAESDHRDESSRDRAHIKEIGGNQGGEKAEGDAHQGADDR